jgi:hypothetical protein
LKRSKYAVSFRHFAWPAFDEDGEDVPIGAEEIEVVLGVLTAIRNEIRPLHRLRASVSCAHPARSRAKEDGV